MIGIMTLLAGSGSNLWLVRHGETNWNQLGLVQGQNDVSRLTRTGHHQAQLLAERFRRRPIDAIFSSDLRRAQETAAPIGDATGARVQTDTALRERCFGNQEGRPVSWQRPAETGIRGDRVEDVGVRPQGGESLEELFGRSEAFIVWLEHHRLRQCHVGDVVVVAHGGSIRAIRAYCAGLTAREIQWDPVPNGSVSWARLPLRFPNFGAPAMLEDNGGIG